MTPEEYVKILQNKAIQMKQLTQRTLPIKIGQIAVSHFKNNIMTSSWDGQAWTRTKRESGGGKKASSRYKPLTSARNYLFGEIRYTPGAATTTIYNNVPYARVHNEGLKAGRGKGFIMPKRQFMGESESLTKKIREKCDQEIKNILLNQ